MKYLFLYSFYFGFALTMFTDLKITDWQFWAIFLPILILVKPLSEKEGER